MWKLQVIWLNIQREDLIEVVQLLEGVYTISVLKDCGETFLLDAFPFFIIIFYSIEELEILDINCPYDIYALH